MFKFALRNVFRNKKRSFLTALSVFFGAMVVGMMLGYMSGMFDSMINNFIAFQTSHARVTTEEFRKREKFMPVDQVMPDGAELMEKIKKIDGVKRVEERARFGILLAKGDNTISAMGVGVELENNTFNITNKLVTTPIRTNSKKDVYAGSGIYIGQGLAKKLGAKKGDMLKLATKTSEGGLNGIKLPVKGFVAFGIGMYDNHLFFIDIKDAKKLLKIHDGTLEIYVEGEKVDFADRITADIKKLLPKPKDEFSPKYLAMSFKDQIGFIYYFLEAYKVILLFVLAGVLFLASFVIINTMMMNIFERLPEIGTLKAIGMTDRDLFANFTLEGAIIGAMGGIPGAIIGVSIMIYLGIVGIDFSTMMEGIDFPISYIIYPNVRVTDAIVAIVMSILVPAIAAMLPARWAGKLTPVEALHKK